MSSSTSLSPSLRINGPAPIVGGRGIYAQSYSDCATSHGSERKTAITSWAINRNSKLLWFDLLVVIVVYDCDREKRGRYLYDSGAFCTTFHAGLAGWKACLICKKYLHCGCIVSEKDIFVMNFGGVCCLVCAKKYLLPAEDETDEDKPVNDCPPLLTWNNSSANQSMDRPSNETKTGDGCFSRRNSTMAAPNESTHQMVISGAQCKQKNAVLGGGSSSTAMYNASSSLSENNGTQPNHSGSCLYVSPQTGLIRFLNFGQMKEQQYLKDLGFLNSTMTPMFKKVLSATDTKVKSGRLVIPTKGARGYIDIVDYY
nr:uncharacterized protein LOC112769742 [Arachis hypogaea]